MRAQQAAELGGLARVEPGGRLVEAEQLGPGAHGPRDLEPALLAVGQVGGVPVGPVDQADALEPAARPLDRRRLGTAIAGKAEHAEHGVAGRPHQLVVLRDDQVLEHGHLAEQPDVLEGARDAGAGDAEPVHLLEQQRVAVAMEGELADGRLVEAGQAVEHRGLAGAVGADDRGDLALAGGQRQIVDRDQAAEAHRQMLRPRAAARSCVPAGAGHGGAGRRGGGPMQMDGRLAMGEQAARPPDHDHDHRRAEQQHAELRELAPELGQQDQHHRGQHHADLAAHAAQHDDREDQAPIR